LGTHTITASGNTQHKTAQYKFGATSMYFDGSGDYLSIPDHDDFHFAGGDFTVDFWIYKDSSVYEEYEGIVGQFWNTSPFQQAWMLAFHNDSKLYFHYDASPTGGSETTTSGVTFTSFDDKWTHVALVRNSTNLYMFFDGTLQLTHNIGSNLIGDAATPLIIGGYRDYIKLKGYLDEFRISKGIARWTEDFTVPYKAYADSTPALLTGGYTITGSGTIENGLIDSTDQWEGSTYINTLGTVLEGELTGNVKFPAGHVIQTVHGANMTVGGSTGSTSYIATSLSVTIDPIYTNSMIEIEWQISSTHWNKGNGNSRGCLIIRNTTAGAYIPGSRMDAWFEGGTSYLYLPLNGRCREILSTGAAQTYVLYARAGSGTFYYMNNATNPGYGSGEENHLAQIKATEIKQ
jgi:hypothetical protein